MPDCDMDQAVNGLMGAAYGSAGERCMAQSVAVAVGGIGDKLVEKLSKKVEALKVGIINSGSEPIPDGQRDVIVLSLV